MQSIIVFIAAGCLAGLHVSAAPAQDEFETLFDEVFGAEAKQLGFDGTLERLKTMSDIKENPDVANLVTASQVTERNCNWPMMDAMSLLMKTHSIYSVNILPYLTHWRQELFSVCAKDFSNELRSAVKSSFEEVEQEATTLREEIISSRVGEVIADLPVGSYAAGIVRFLELKLVSLDAKLNRDRVGFLVIKHVEPVCGTVLIDFDLIIKNYERLLGDEKIKAKMSPFVLDWINNVRMCRHIFDEFGSIVSEIHSIIGRQAD